MPPSVPACRIQGTLDVGSDIMLLCSSEEGIPTPSYSWEKLDTLPKLPHNAMQGITNKLAVGVPFCPTFAGKSHTHSLAETQQQSHHHRHLSCARPKQLPARRFPSSDPAEGWWWMDGWSDSNHVNLWMTVCLCFRNVFVYEQSVGFVASLMLNTSAKNSCVSWTGAITLTILLQL